MKLIQQNCPSNQSVSSYTHTDERVPTSLPERIQSILGVRVLASLIERCQGCDVLDLSEEDLGLAVALLDRSVGGQRTSVELEVQF
jgi:hypothetical protein